MAVREGLGGNRRRRARQQRWPRGCSVGESSSSSSRVLFGDKAAAGAAATRGRGGPLRARARHRSIGRVSLSATSASSDWGLEKSETKKRETKSERAKPKTQKDTKKSCLNFPSPSLSYVSLAIFFERKSPSRNQSSDPGPRRSHRGVGRWRLAIALAREPESPEPG